jgi:hypothetical protein
MEKNIKTISFDYNKIKQKLLNIIVKIDGFYSDLNKKILYPLWILILKRQSDNRFTKALKILIENPATALLLNTILFAVVGVVFGGLIERVMLTLSGLNILIFCIKILGWEDKLKD